MSLALVATTFLTSVGWAGTPALDKAAETMDTAFYVSPGFDYITGKYGFENKTEMYVASLNAKYSIQNWAIRAYVPYLSVKSHGGVTVINGRPVPTLGAVARSAVERRLGLTLPQILALTPQQRQARIDVANTPSQTNSGIGDVEVSLDYAVYRKAAWDVSLSGTVKLGTGDEEKGLGTGETDYRLSTDIYRSFGDFIPFVRLGYCIMGKPEGSDLRNYFFGSAGLNYSFTPHTDLTLTFSHVQRSSDSAGADDELILMLNRYFGKSWNAEFHVLTGLSTNSPDFGAGVSIGRSF